MTRLIVNADDFGLTPGVNAGILEAHRQGIVTSTTLMVNMGAAEEALRLAADCPTLGVGIHLTLTAGHAVSTEVPSLVDRAGRFWNLKHLAQFARPDDIRREFRCQMERFLSFGKKPTHIDSHHHVHGEPSIRPIVLDLAREYDLPVRNAPVPDNAATLPESDSGRMAGGMQPDHEANGLEQLPVRHAAFLSTRFYGERATFEVFVEELQKASMFDTVEIMVHPAHADAALVNGSSYSHNRERELAVLTDPRLPDVLASWGMQRIHYGQL